MGNGITKIQSCCPGAVPGTISGRHHHHDIAAVLYSNKNNNSNQTTDDGLGHSFCYIRPDPYSNFSTNSASKIHSEFDTKTKTFRSISGASVSANTYNPLTTSLLDLYSYSTTSCFDKASAFESSTSFAAIPLQPVPKINITAPLIKGGSGPIEKGFLSGPIERGLYSGPMEKENISTNHHQSHISSKSKFKLKNSSKKQKLLTFFNKVLRQSGKRVKSGSGSGQNRGVVEGEYAPGDDGLERISGDVTLSSDSSVNISSCLSLNDNYEEEDDDDDEDDDECYKSQNLQWAQGKAGEDRVHIVISEQHGWVFVGIYDGFNGPDAPDYLLANLYSTIAKQLEGLPTKNKSSDTSTTKSFECNVMESVEHCDVLKALRQALMKTEQEFLEIADKMLVENPELALMGSCVLVMLMKGEHVYLMNVGDSRAVLAKSEPFLSETSANDEIEFDNVPSGLTSVQLTVDHSTNEQEEVEKIIKEHPDDPRVIVKNRVKGSLKVTRAFGAGFLKQQKWNNALLEAFRIDYTSDTSYITCNPSLQHHRLGPTDRFLILSSDGLYQYFTNQEAVSEVETFMDTFPEGDPAQHLIEQVLFRAAKKAGMDFHELLDIPQGDRRRRYHDDVSIIIISLEGRIWKSSM